MENLTIADNQLDAQKDFTKESCPIARALTMIGTKWKPVIIYYLGGGTKRFGQLQRLIPGLSQQMLTQHLRELEHDELITRKVYAQVPPKVEYELTARGRSLFGIVTQIDEWSRTNVPVQ